MTDASAHDASDQLSRLTAVARASLARWAETFEDMSLVKYRENAVFRVRDSRGRQFALRVHRPGYHSDAELRSELQWMSALEEAGIGVPTIIPARDGDLLVRVDAPGFAGPVQVDMLAWFDGEPIGSTETGFDCSDSELRNLYRQVGEVAARIHEHGADWPRPAGFARHSWDAAGLLGPEPFWGDFRRLPALSSQLPLIDEACAQAAKELDALGNSSRIYGMLHADLLPENVLRRADRIMLIDFDDAGFGWHMFELATALFFHMEAPYYQAIRESLFAGYDSVRPLPTDHPRQLKLFMFLRSLTYLGWASTRSETETARELTPLFVDKAAGCARSYLR